MKKKLILLLAVIMMAAGVFSGCSANFSRIKIRSDFKQSYDYVVTSNGGSAVQYGDYIYFINGYKGYDDPDGKSNRWDHVTKGALYKAKLHGSRDINNTRMFEPAFDPAGTEIEFYSHKGIKYEHEVDEDLEDDEKEEINIVDVQLIAPKVIGTSGYAKGGIFIYDNYVYYATPNNTFDRSGNTQVTKTDFMRTKLDGTKTQLIYTTEGKSDDQPYAFYKQGNSVYLVCSFANSNGLFTIASVKMTGDKKGRVVYITKKATSVLLPTRSVYDKNNPPVFGLEDYVFYTRRITGAATATSGNVIEVCLPDGSEGLNTNMTGKDITLVSVSGDSLFYRHTDSMGNEVLKFTNLYSTLYKIDDESPYSKTYTAYENSRDEEERRQNIAPTVLYDYTNLSSYSDIYCFKTEIYAPTAYMFAFSANDVKLFSSDGSQKTILSESATLHAIVEESCEMYFAGSDGSTLYKVNYVDGGTKVQASRSNMVSGAYKADYVAGYIMYFSTVDRWSGDSAYPYFVKQTIEGAEEVLVYKRASEDEKPDDYEEEEEGAE